MVQEDDRFVQHGPKPSEPLPGITLGQLIYTRLVNNPNTRAALVDVLTKRSYSFRHVLGLCSSLAQTLTKLGLGVGSMISVSSENNIEFFIPILSAMLIGCTVATLNHNYTELELLHCLNITKPSIIFTSKEVCQKYVDLKKKLNFIKMIVVIDSEEYFDGTVSILGLIERALGRRGLIYKFQVADYDPDDTVAVVMSSSGTTGLPKGVMQTHTNLVVRYMHTRDPSYVYPHETFLGLMPFFHGYGFTVNLIAIIMGETVVVMKRFEEELFLKTIQDYRITNLWLAPPLLVFLAKSPLVKKYDLSCVKEIVSGAAPLSKETEETVKRRIGVNAIRQGYGLTEATLAVLMLRTDQSKPGSSGKVVPYMLCKVRDPETGKSLGPNEVGELCFKGPMVMKGYYGNKEATEQTFTSDGWLKSGDLAYYDNEGFFFIVDRLKELIKYKGYQVPPAELEAVILSNPKIQDVGVIGVPNEEAGELPLAFIVKRPGVTLTEKDVEDYVATRVSPQKKLRGGVIFTNAIPRNASGKILRRDLKKMLDNVPAKL